MTASKTASKKAAKSPSKERATAAAAKSGAMKFLGCVNNEGGNSSGLQHVTKFPEEFEVRTNTLSQEELHAIREKIANFLMNQVILEKGEFHWSNKNPGFNLKV
ncbi:hypothetical protein C2845_PM07G11200 [Panicum miliaceum]|uniref:Uncharacterized protein n=1 Tax=Panicum miliaceum TaxID=4540 RepID=A0A3L6SJR4_PANMI|nr:hypothetical protein C2845_PM07G11200 [Panicum miliaceum]